jgi:hypothetical protein
MTTRFGIDEDDHSKFFTITYLNVGAINEAIEKLETEDYDKRTKAYQMWVDKMNHLFTLYNKEVGEKIYKKI